MFIRYIPRYCKCIGIVFVMLFTLSACEYLLPEPHKIDIQQGNQLKQEDVEKLYTGMSRNDVIGLLGKPLIEDPFHPDRLDYVYRLKPGKGKLKKSRLTLYFKDNALIRIDSKEFKEY
jgi:outer membrane protein assembly factor BamE